MSYVGRCCISFELPDHDGCLTVAVGPNRLELAGCQVSQNGQALLPNQSNKIISGANYFLFSLAVSVNLKISSLLAVCTTAVQEAGGGHWLLFLEELGVH